MASLSDSSSKNKKAGGGRRPPVVQYFRNLAKKREKSDVPANSVQEHSDDGALVSLPDVPRCGCGVRHLPACPDGGAAKRAEYDAYWAEFEALEARKSRVAASSAGGEGSSLDNGRISRRGDFDAPEGCRPYVPGERVVLPDGRVWSVAEARPGLVGKVAGHIAFYPGGVVARPVSIGPEVVADGGGRPEGAVIRGMSDDSRRRYEQKLMRVPWHLYTGEKGRKRSRSFLLTLTYPGDWVEAATCDYAAWTSQFEAFKKRLKRMLSRVGMPTGASDLYVSWKKEFQERGAPHYHLIVLLPAEIGRNWFNRWAKRAWSEVVANYAGRDFPHHAKQGAKAVPLYGDGSKLMQYLVKYMCKQSQLLDEETGELFVPLEVYQNGTGRAWGGSLPSGDSIVVAVDSAKDWAEFIRRVRALGKGKSWFLEQFESGRVYGDGLRMFWDLLAGLEVRVMYDSGRYLSGRRGENVLRVPDMRD